MGNSTSGEDPLRAGRATGADKRSEHIHGGDYPRHEDTRDKSSSKTKSIGVIVDQKLPALTVLKDNWSQTNQAKRNMYTLKPRRIIACCGNTFIIIAGAYMVLSFLMITSPYFQALVTYGHFIKWSGRDLTQLESLNLAEARNVAFETEDGLNIYGWHVAPPNEALLQAHIVNNTERELFFDYGLAHAERIVVFFHGNSATRAQQFRVDLIKQVATHLNAHVISFDYRGFAESDGSPTEYGTHLDGRAVVKWIDSTVRRHNRSAKGYLSTSAKRRANAAEYGRVMAQLSEVPQLRFETPALKDMLKRAEFLRLEGFSADAEEGVVTPPSSPSPLSASVQSKASSSPAAASSSPFSFSAAIRTGTDTIGNDCITTGDEDSDCVDGVTSCTEVPRQDEASHAKVTPAPRRQPHLFFYGHSLGASISTSLAVEMNHNKPGSVTGLILDAAIASLLEAGKTHPLAALFRIFPVIFNLM